ncbi:MAG TPA: serine hydrolase domain-containing protein [Candidatus Baltobacteraceae bacterium]|nr:serine hydrolase domain-containing protein [Candidatus Baltobacteraceae bacterium]
MPASVVAQVDSVLESAMKHQHLPGVSVAVAVDGHVVYAHGYGYRNVPKRLPSNGHTVYNIASTSKQFVAAAIMRLQQQGLLNVNDRLSKYYPQYKYADRVTLRQLLTHTSGIPDYLDQSGFPPNATAAQQVAAIAKMPPEFLPGTRFEYSNSNYVILGLIVEKLTHRSLFDVWRQWFFIPLGMRDSTAGELPWTLSNGAMGYTYKSGSFVAIPQTVAQYGYGDGGVDSSAYDLNVWDQALIAGRVVDEASLRAMTTPPQAPDGEPQPGGYGFGLEVGTLFGHREWQHGGDNEGFHTGNAVFPDDRFSVAIVSNGNQFDYEWLVTKLFALFYPPSQAQWSEFYAGAPHQNTAVAARALGVLRRMETGTIKKSDVLAPAIVSQIPGTPKEMAANAGAVGQWTHAVYRGMEFRSGNSIYDYLVFYPHAVVAYYFVLTPRGAVYAALPVRAD